MVTVKNLEELREELWEMRTYHTESFFSYVPNEDEKDNLKERYDFSKGYTHAIESVENIIRRSLKHREDA